MVHSRFIPRSLVVGTIVTNLAAIALIPCGDTDKQSESPEPAATVHSAVSTGSIARPAPETNSPWFGEIQRLLAGIPTGNAALMVLEGYDVSVTLEAGQGSYYLPAHIVIDSDWGIVAAAVDLVHEATHARFRSEGLTPDPMSVTRDEYVARRIEEEAEGQANAIQAKIELEAMEIDVSEARPWFEMQYRSAYGEAVRKNPKATEAALRQFGWEMGKNELIKGFMGGGAVASNGELQYSEIYGREWDTFAAYEATHSGSGDEAAAAAPKSPTLKLDADPTAEEANDVPTTQVDPEPAGLVAFGSIISALARDGLSPLADGLLQLVYSLLSWGRMPLRGRVAERLEDLCTADGESEAVEVAGKAVHRGGMIQIASYSRRRTESIRSILATQLAQAGDAPLQNGVDQAPIRERRQTRADQKEIVWDNADSPIVHPRRFQTNSFGRAGSGGDSSMLASSRRCSSIMTLT